ncbi:MAG: PDZ domain-containing protein [Bacillota bacterium]
MQSLLAMAQYLLKSLPQLLLSVWAMLLLLVAAAIVFAQYRRIALTEQELYGLPKRSPLVQTQQSLLAGVAGGLAGSMVLSAAGVGLVEVPDATSALLYLWPVSILLGALNPRLICFAYSAMVVSLSHLIFGWPQLDIPSVLGLVAVLHLVEAVLIWGNGAMCPTPLSIAGGQDEPVPGFLLQRYWPVPLVIPLFSAAGAPAVEMPTWWPLLRPDSASILGAVTMGWEFLPLVVVLGYSDLAIASPPESRVRQSSGLMLLYSGILLALAISGSYFRPLLWLGVLFSGLGHEAMVVFTSRLQMIGEPYLQRPARGLAVLDVLPGSPAAQAGLRSGMVVVTVDDYEVHTREQLHEALLSSPAYVSIMYRKGRQLEHCRIPRPPEGFYGFGMIPVPEPGDRALARLRRPAFFRWFGIER